MSNIEVNLAKEYAKFVKQYGLDHNPADCIICDDLLKEYEKMSFNSIDKNKLKSFIVPMIPNEVNTKINIDLTSEIVPAQKLYMPGSDLPAGIVMSWNPGKFSVDEVVTSEPQMTKQSWTGGITFSVQGEDTKLVEARKRLLKELLEVGLHPSIKKVKLYKYLERETINSEIVSKDNIDNNPYFILNPGEELAIECFAINDNDEEVFIPFIDLSITADEAIKNRNLDLLTEGTGLDIPPVIYNSGNAAHAYWPIALSKDQMKPFYGNLMLSTIDPKTNKSILDLRWVGWLLSKGSNGLRISCKNTKKGTILPKRKVQFEL